MLERDNLMNNIASKAEQGFSDIGVKNGQNVRLRDADGDDKSVADEGLPYAEADNSNGTYTAPEGELHTADEDSEKLDAEFEELIRTRYRNSYRKRTEAIVRRRLRSVKAKPNAADDMQDEKVSETVKNTDKALESPSDAAVSEDTPKPDKRKMQIQQNQNRPSENGIVTSVGMYSRADVSKLTGKEIRDILARAGRGERIRFR